MLTVADLLKRFGPIPAYRIRNWPPPGTATERDVTDIESREDWLCELIDGVLVQKTIGLYESALAARLVSLLFNFLDRHDLGVVLGAGATLRVLPCQVRIPDVSFISWDRIPGNEFPREPIPDLVPDLAIEVLSPDNTRREMERKLRDYFKAGTHLVWYVDPEHQTVQVYTSPRKSKLFRDGDTLDGGPVLPGFRLPVKRIFARFARGSR
jgi:Uma2 family endonuclease